jgi:hypothetical protein
MNKFEERIIKRNEKHYKAATEALGLALSNLILHDEDETREAFIAAIKNYICNNIVFHVGNPNLTSHIINECLGYTIVTINPTDADVDVVKALIDADLALAILGNIILLGITNDQIEAMLTSHDSGQINKFVIETNEFEILRSDEITNAALDYITKRNERTAANKAARANKINSPTSLAEITKPGNYEKHVEQKKLKKEARKLLATAKKSQDKNNRIAELMLELNEELAKLDGPIEIKAEIPADAPLEIPADAPIEIKAKPVQNNKVGQLSANQKKKQAMAARRAKQAAAANK